MSNTLTNPIYVKALPHPAGERQVGDADPNSQADVINRTAKSLTAVLKRLINAQYDGLTLDMSDPATTTALATAKLINPLFVPKLADEGVTSSSTLQDDNELFAAIAANETVYFFCLLHWTGPTAGDIKWAFTVPVTATLVCAPASAYLAADGTTTNQSTTITASGTSVTEGVTGGNSQLIAGRVVNGATAGNLQLQWAQGTVDGSTTNVKAHSFLAVFRR